MLINGRQFTIEKTPVEQGNEDLDSGFVLVSKRGIRYRMFRNDHDRSLLFGVPENWMKHPDPNIWVKEEHLQKELTPATTSTPVTP